MNDMRPLVISEHVAPDHSPCLRVVTGKESWVAQQDPIEKDDIIRLEQYHHQTEPQKELPESKAIIDAVLRTCDYRSDIHRDRNECKDEAYHMLSFESLRLGGDDRQDIFVGRGEEALVLDKCNAWPEHEKKPGHGYYRQYQCQDQMRFASSGLLLVSANRGDFITMSRSFQYWKRFMGQKTI